MISGWVIPMGLAAASPPVISATRAHAALWARSAKESMGSFFRSSCLNHEASRPCDPRRHHACKNSSVVIRAFTASATAPARTVRVTGARLLALSASQSVQVCSVTSSGRSSGGCFAALGCLAGFSAGGTPPVGGGGSVLGLVLGAWERARGALPSESVGTAFAMRSLCVRIAGALLHRASADAFALRCLSW
jgi:hypothetical protein